MDPSTATVVAAGISFIAGVAAVVAGQLLNARYQRQSEDRRWEREETRRRTVVAEERARQCRLELLVAAKAISYEAGRRRTEELARNDPPGMRRRHSWTPPLDSGEMQVHLEAADEAALEINDRNIRGLVGQVRSVLSDYQTIVERSDRSPGEISAACVEAVDGSFGAYLRGEPLPSVAVIAGMAAALEEEERMLDAYYRQEAARRSAERAAQHASRDGADQ